MTFLVATKEQKEQLEGCVRANPYQYMVNNGGDTLLADGIHTNNAGHQVIADYMANLIA